MKHKILVADDDFDNRTIVQEALEAAGYEVVMATNGEEALEKIASEHPEVVLLDLSMPKINGWEVAKRIRENEALENMPIIAFTAHALVGEELKAKAAGCDDYISKPCLPKEVVERITHWIKEKANRPAGRQDPAAA
jgi:two-component system cell cycle response regulator DivK